MSIRTINFNVEADKITPSTLQRGGLQGEHNATELNFKVENSLVEKLRQASMGASIYYRFEGHTGIGLKNSTLPVVLNIPDDYSNGVYLNYLLENWLTREGGNITVYLIFSIISKAETLVDIYSYPARLRLEAVPDGKYTDGKNYESVAKLSVAAEDAAERAESAAEISEAAKEQTVDARFALENGAEFIFLGGDASGAAEVDLVVDSELSEHSSNPISNEVVAKELKKYTPTEQSDEKYVDAEDYASDKEKLDSIVDYPVEIGEKDGWTYRKFNSGEVMCRKKISGTVKVDNPYGNLRYGIIEAIDFPFQFDGTPILITDLDAPNCWRIKEKATNSNTGKIYAVSGGEIEDDYILNIVVIGSLEKEE